MSSREYISEYINGYVDEELPKARELSSNTSKSYVLTLKQFMSFAGLRMGIRPSKVKSIDLSFDVVRDFLIDGKSRLKWGRSTYNLKLAGIRSFVSFLALVDPSFLDLSRRISLIRGQRILKIKADYLLETHFLEVVDVRPKSNFELRDRAMMMFMFYTGCRVSEVTCLRWNDLKWINSKTAHLSILGKGRKKRKIPLLNAAVIADLRKLEKNNTEWESEFVFCTRDYHRMSADNIRRIVKRTFHEKHPEINITPHSLRHSAAMNWLSKGLDLFTISALLGHETIATTEHYLKSRFESHEEAMRKSNSSALNTRLFTTRFESNDDLIASLNMRIKRYDLNRN